MRGTQRTRAIRATMPSPSSRTTTTTTTKEY